MTIKTERLILRNMIENDYEALYKVLTDSDIMQHYPYTFDEARVRGWIKCYLWNYSNIYWSISRQIGWSAWN